MARECGALPAGLCFVTGGTELEDSFFVAGDLHEPGATITNVAEVIAHDVADVEIFAVLVLEACVHEPTIRCGVKIDK